MNADQELRLDDLHEVLGSIDIPPCPAVVTQVMAAAQKDVPDLNALTDIIAGDVGMSAFAIKLANSPLFRRGNPTSSLPMAVSRLGMRNVVCVVVAVALRDTMKGDIEAAVLDRFWNRASIVAQVASQAARKLRGIAPDLVYTYALFHDAAVPVMMRRFKDYGAMLEQVEKSGASLVAEEDARYRCTHAVVGAMLARNWGLSASISSAVRFHHDREVYDLANPFLDDQTLSLIAVTHVAEHLVLEQNGEADAEVGDLFPLAVAYLGLSKDDLHDLEELLAAQT